MLSSTFKELVSPHQREYSTSMREAKVQLRVGLGWKRVSEITYSFNYTSQRAPLDDGAGNVGKREHWELIYV